MVKASPAERDRRLAELEGAENFPVALRLLPPTVRVHLRAVYDVARVIDDTGDEVDGDQSAALLKVRAELGRVWSDDPPTSGVFARLVPTARACGLEAELFDRLIEANLQDQTVSRFPRRSDLLAYCTLSADPVGRLVLAVFRASTPRTVELSDRICTALQLIEHCQDIGEDYHRGRIYLPLEELERHRVSEAEFGAARASARLRHLVRSEALTAHASLTSGEPLVGLLHGFARLAVAGYLAGGLAALDALRRADWHVLPAGPRPRRLDVVRHAVRLLATAAVGRHS
jgi:squalene synthase HpnC